MRRRRRPTAADLLTAQAAAQALDRFLTPAAPPSAAARQRHAQQEFRAWIAAELLNRRWPTPDQMQAARDAIVARWKKS